MLTGDTLFIGDVGRPDLAPDHTPQQLAALLYDSLHQKLLTLPDDVRVYPAHGAGSLCGRQMSSERSSTIGQQRLTNYALRAATRDEIRPPAHRCAARAARLLRARCRNQSYRSRRARRSAAARRTQPHCGRRRHAIRSHRARHPPDAQFAAAHVPGSINIPLSGQFASSADSLPGLETDLLLIAENPDRAAESRLRLARVGIERVAGYVAGGLPAWITAGQPVARLTHITVEDLARLHRENPALQIADVRRPAEWDDAHIEGAVLLPLNRLATSLTQLDPARPVAVHCKSGYRSAIAASLLLRAGFPQVLNVTGGFDAWQSAGMPAAQVAVA